MCGGRKATGAVFRASCCVLGESIAWRRRRHRRALAALIRRHVQRAVRCGFTPRKRAMCVQSGRRETARRCVGLGACVDAHFLGRRVPFLGTPLVYRLNRTATRLQRSSAEEAARGGRRTRNLCWCWSARRFTAPHLVKKIQCCSPLCVCWFCFAACRAFSYFTAFMFTLLLVNMKSVRLYTRSPTHSKPHRYCCSTHVAYTTKHQH